ncbi:hypothetical protein [Streptomyces sp. SAI-124]|uniref:hypothetical protein n=1 Tax=Streptomyces sp. SAI-124 TaxID=3377730 RepID=UPI003C7B966A
MRLRIVGLNSVEVAEAVGAGDLEAGLVVPPIDAEGLDVTPSCATRWSKPPSTPTTPHDRSP